MHFCAYTVLSIDHELIKSQLYVMADLAVLRVQTCVVCPGVRMCIYKTVGGGVTKHAYFMHGV